MGKKKQLKSKKRISGAVRKTCASLLMVTALIVAAIPGKQIQAYEDEEAVGTTHVEGNNFLADDGLVYTIVGGRLTNIEVRDDLDVDVWDSSTSELVSTSVVSTPDGWSTSIRSSKSISSSIKEKLPSYPQVTEADVTSISLPVVEGMKILSIAPGVFDKFPQLRNVSLSDTVSSIPKNAFVNCTNLQSVTGTSLVREIGDSAFEGLHNFKTYGATSSLDKVGNKAFKDSGITKFDFNSVISDLGTEAFSGSAIGSVTIPDGNLTEIPDQAFFNCKRLSSVSIGNSVESIGYRAFYGAPITPSVAGMDSVKFIGAEAFAGSGVKKFTFPENLLSVPQGILSDCTSLTEVEFPDPVLYKNMNSGYEFNNCSSLKELTLPEPITTINERTLKGCKAIQTLTLPESMVALPSVEGLESLNKLVVNGKTTDISPTKAWNDDMHIYAYEDSKAAEYAKQNNISLVTLDNPSSQTTDFYTVDENGVIIAVDTARLTADTTIIDIPSKVDGKTVTGIAAGAGIFQGNNQITEVVIPNSVKNVDANAFNGCSKLKVVRFESDETVFGNDAFANCNKSLVLHGPISETSEPFIAAMEQGLTYEDENGNVVKRFYDADGNPVNTLIAYDENAENVYIPAGIEAFADKGNGTAAGTSLFDGNQKMQTITIEGVKKFNDHQFKNCSKLKNVQLPAVLSDMGVCPFYGCTSLEDVNISGANKNYQCDNGVIYKLSGNTKTGIEEVLPGCRGNINYYIPGTITDISDEAFATTQYVNTVTFSSGVSSVPNGCFRDSEVSNVILTGAVHAIDTDAFKNSDLTNLYVPNRTTYFRGDVSNGVTGLILHGPDENCTAYNYYEDYKDRGYTFVADGKDDPSTSSSRTDTTGWSTSTDSGSTITTSGSTDSKSTDSKSEKTTKKDTTGSKKSSKKKSSKKSSNKGKTVTEKTTVYSSTGNGGAGASAAGLFVPSPITDVATTSGDLIVNESGGNDIYVDAGDAGFGDESVVSGTIDGTTDNYVIKISQNDETTSAFEQALTDEFSSLDNLRYYPMDISLYDSTGTTLIEEPQGVEVTVTIPIPEELALYGGNNHVAAVKEGKLEELATRFSSIDGTPCVTFTATHFSPYGLYVDVTNLKAADALDSSPKTGDPISPKWFLVIGLAAASIFLFMKKEPALA